MSKATHFSPADADVARQTGGEPAAGLAGRWLVYLTWGALIYNVAVILWGAVVRLTGSGAGCGDHWPLCDGVVVPLSFTAERVIEYSHRLTSGASGLLAMGTFAAAFALPLRKAVSRPERGGMVKLSFGAGLGAAALLAAGAVLGQGTVLLSGAGLGLLCLVWWLTALLRTRDLSWRTTFGRWPVVLGAVLSFVFILLEGVVGGVQVLLGLTADSTDPARGLFQGVHLANTFVLLAVLLLTALWASGFPALQLRALAPEKRRTLWAVVTGLVLCLLVGMTGAVTALGDLLFRPAPGTPLDTLRNDFGLNASFFERLRVLHPLLAVGTSAYLVWMALRVREWVATPQVTFWSRVLLGTVAAQILAGVMNVALRAPDAMQLLHLLLACMLWLMTILLGYFALFRRPRSQPNSRIEAGSALGLREGALE